MSTYLANKIFADEYICIEFEADNWDEALFHALCNDLEIIGKISDCPPEIVAMVEKHVTQPMSH